MREELQPQWSPSIRAAMNGIDAREALWVGNKVEKECLARGNGLQGSPQSRPQQIDLLHALAGAAIGFSEFDVVGCGLNDVADEIAFPQGDAIGVYLNIPGLGNILPVVAKRHLVFLRESESSWGRDLLSHAPFAQN